MPQPQQTLDELGLVAIGGELNTQSVLSAYKLGAFPWYSANEPLMWWSPDPRLVLVPSKLKVSKSLQRTLRNSKYSLALDQRFETVIHHCSQIQRKDQKDSWITPKMQQVYIELHLEGYAHSIEVLDQGQLVGGLYGLAIGRFFFGESMFAFQNDSSKIALFALSQLLQTWDFALIDCQVVTDHLLSLGAQVMPREEFLAQLKLAIQQDGKPQKWDRIQPEQFTINARQTFNLLNSLNQVKIM